MAWRLKTRRPAEILPFRRPCKSVSQTDRDARLPTLSSAEVETLFDHLQRRDAELSRAA